MQFIVQIKGRKITVYFYALDNLSPPSKIMRLDVGLQHNAFAHLDKITYLPQSFRNLNSTSPTRIFFPDHLSF